MRCEDCFYWDKDGSGIRSCFRNPPVIIREKTFNGSDYYTRSVRAFTGAEEFCGEFKEKENGTN